MLNYNENELKAAAQRTANAYVKIANTRLGCNLPYPIPVEFDLCEERPKAGGQAHSMPLKIKLNMVMFIDNVREFLNQVVGHEIAHLVVYNRFNHRGLDAEGHGAEWKEVMRKLGLEPLKYHHMDVSKSLEHHKKMKVAKRKSKKREAKGDEE